VEALIAGPLIVTAFSAALFGGLLSPALKYGFERMNEYEIRWPEFTRKKKKSGKGKNRSLYEDPGFSWISTLETVGDMVAQLRTKRSPESKLLKFLKKS